MTNTMLNRRMLLIGLTTSAGATILAACAAPGATTAPTTTGASGSAASGAGTRPAGTTGAGAANTGNGGANMGGGTGNGAVTAVPGGGAPMNAGGAAGAAGTTGAAGGAGGAGMARPGGTGGMGNAPAGSTGATMGTVTGGAMTGPAAGGTGAMPTATIGPMGPSLCAQGNITALGSTALQPIVDAAQQVYTAKCNAAQITVRGGDSGMGVMQVFNGQIAIGVSDIFAEEISGIDARQLEDHQVCIQPFAIATNPGVNITNLTPDQVISIFTGKVTNYRDVGGPNQAIVVVNRPVASGVRAIFRRYGLNGLNEVAGKTVVDDSSGAVADAIKGTPGAIGYLPLASFAQNNGLKVVNFGGKAPTIGNISDGSYPLWTYGHLYTKGPAAGLAKGFIDYLLSDDAQATLVPQLGYLPFLRVKTRRHNRRKRLHFLRPHADRPLSSPNHQTITMR